MEAQDHQTAKIKPAVVKKPKQVVKYPIHCRTQIQLMAKGGKLNTEVDTLVGEGCIINVSCMSAFVRQHCLVDNWIQVDS